MPIYDYEYNGKIYSFESDAQPDEQEVMNFINNYKAPQTPTPKQQPQIETPKAEPKVEEPKTEEQPTVLEGKIEKTYKPNWDNEGRFYYTDENNNKVNLTPNLGEKGKLYYTDENGNKVNDYSPTLANMWKAANDEEYGLNFAKVQAKKQLNDRELWEHNHPFISGIQRDYQPGYRADKEKWKEQLKYGLRGMHDVPAKEIAKTDLKRGFLNLIPAVNIVTDIATMGEDVPAKQMVKQGLKTGLTGGGVLGLTSAAGDIMQGDATPIELLTRPLLYGGVGSLMGLGGGAVGRNIANARRLKNINYAKEMKSEWGIPYTKYSGDIDGAIQKLLKEKKGYVPKAFYKDGIGDVDLVWGTHNYETGEGYGLEHIIARRKKQNIDANKFVNELPDLIRNGLVKDETIIDKNGQPQLRKIIENPDKKMAIILDWNGKSRKWVVTAHRQNKSAAKRLMKNAPLSNITSNTGTRSISELGADTTSIAQNSKKFNPNVKKTSQLGQSDYVNETFGHNINRDYDVLSNEELIKSANEEVTKNADVVKSDLLARGGNEQAEFSAFDFEKGRQLLSQLYKEGKVQEAMDLTEVLTRKGTQAGQAVQAMSLWSKTTPEGAELFAQRVINKYNDAHPKKPITLTPEKRQLIRELAENIQKTPDGYDKDFATASMLKEISDLVPKSASDKFRTLRNISLLLNMKTFNRNLIGNSILGSAENITTKPLAAGIDKVVSLATGERSRVTTQGAEYLKGLWEGAKRGNKEVLAGVNTRNIGSRFDLPNTRTFKAPVLKQLEIATDWSLRVPDSAFYQASFEESLVNQIRAEMMNKGLKPRKLTPKMIEEYTTPKMVKQATDEALESVYQNNGALSDLLTTVRKGSRKLNKFIGLNDDFGVGDVLLPYAQTPANVAEMGLNYSPFGLLKGGINLAKGNQRQGTLDLARGLVGTGLGVGGYELAKNGLITPNVENARDRGNLELLGQRPNNLKIGDNYYSYTQLQPLASSLASGASIANSATPIEATDNYLSTVLDTSMMRGLSQLLEDNERYGTMTAIANGILGLPSQLVPTSMNQLNAYIDPVQRETYDPSPIKRTANYINAKVPGLSKTLPEKYNLKGEAKQKYESEGIGKAFDVFANPIFRNKAKDDVIVQELLELKKNTGENVLLPIASKKISKADNLKLSGKQYSEYQKVLGEKIYEGLDDLMNDPQYYNSDDTTRANLVEQRQKMIRAFVDEQLFGVENSYKKKPKDLVKKVENKIKTFNSKINKLKTMKLLYNDLNIQDIDSILEE